MAIVCASYLLAGLTLLGANGNVSMVTGDHVIIRIGKRAGVVERNTADLLLQRITMPSKVSVRIEAEDQPSGLTPGCLLVLLGIPANHDELVRHLEASRIKPPSEKDPGPEGFHLHVHPQEGGLLVLAAGTDSRGVLYAAGELLRQLVLQETSITAPEHFDLRTAPAFEVRGTQFGQGGIMLQMTGARAWTQKDIEAAILQYALAGANTFEVSESLSADDPVYCFLKSLGLKTLTHYGPNTGSGPPEWHAAESIGRVGYLCPSVPEAREALLRRCEEVFRNSPPFDYVRFPGGDGGGCECDRCKPYGKTFILLCEDLAGIIHKYHPQTEIFFTNQKFDNADDIAIFEYLREKPRPWLRAFGYGPGSDAMTWQPGHRQHHRMDLFRYPGFGPFDRYLKEILHQLPPEQDIVFFNELTHWYYSQYGYVRFPPRPDQDNETPPHWSHFIYERYPDPYLAMVYERLTFFAWPRYYHYVFGETLRYGIGDVTHSSGYQDHFNQWMWQRLLWSPHRSVEDIVQEYARTWFGPEAAPLMAEALFQLERNLEPSVITNDGIDRYYSLVKDAGKRIPENHMRNNWVWREHMQKAALDKYVRLRVRSQLALQERAESLLAESLKGGDPDAAIRSALAVLGEERESEEMKRLRDEAGRFGEENNIIYGVRNTGYFNLDHDFVGLGWIKRMLERAQAASPEERRKLLLMITDYENAGEGGYYDLAGVPGRAPHMVYGYPYDFGQPYWRGALSEANRASHGRPAFTAQEKQGVTFRYTGLDPQARYRIRVTLVRPRYQERYAARMRQKSQSIYADDILLVKDLEVPEYLSEFFEFDIPREATQDGDLTIRFEKSAGIGEGPRTEVEIWRNTGGWGTIVSEIWLIKEPNT